MVQIVADLKSILLGTFHEVSLEYLNEFLFEFVCRYNRGIWQNHLPLRLLNSAAHHAAFSSKTKTSLAEAIVEA